MSRPLERRLIALERAPGAGGTVLRVYATDAEAAADIEPVAPGVELLRILTGVARPTDEA